MHACMHSCMHKTPKPDGVNQITNNVLYACFLCIYNLSACIYSTYKFWQHPSGWTNMPLVKQFDSLLVTRRIDTISPLSCFRVCMHACIQPKSSCHTYGITCGCDAYAHARIHAWWHTNKHVKITWPEIKSQHYCCIYQNSDGRCMHAINICFWCNSMRCNLRGIKFWMHTCWDVVKSYMQISFWNLSLRYIQCMHQTFEQRKSVQ